MPRMWWYYLEPCNYGPFTSREDAAAAAFKSANVKAVMTGYGSNGAFFDITWPRNPNYKPEED